VATRKSGAEETRQRVEAAIKELGYSPNVAARNLAQGRQCSYWPFVQQSELRLPKRIIGRKYWNRGRPLRMPDHLGKKCGGPKRANGDREASAVMASAEIILPPPLSDSKVALEALRGPPGFHSLPWQRDARKQKACRCASTITRAAARDDTLPFVIGSPKRSALFSVRRTRRPAANAMRDSRRRCMRPNWRYARDWV